ncbi:cutinase-domain-containing protein [Phaeosphaeria sp. MPI-PUGE-AT-0046c]|nr:cutinase-domain-containing protein [Phaeosphaeria sp. MPI-PUGE-AT-0046c]
MARTLLSILFAASWASCALAQSNCPPLPETGVQIGEPVPIVPGDIPKGCSAYEILVARGTSEPSFPKFGVIVGDPVVGNASIALPGYPASSAIITGARQAISDILARLSTQSQLCPNQTFSLVGYSQGASVMHKAAAKIPAALYPKIKSVVMFGDPNLRLGRLGDQFPTALRAKLLQNCAVDDPTCDKGTCQIHHLEYIRPAWTNRAVNFIVKAFQGTPLPPSETIGLD